VGGRLYCARLDASVHEERAEHRAAGLAVGPHLRPVVFGETASRAVFPEPWPPEEVLAIAPRDEVIGYLVVDTVEPRPALGGVGAYPTLSLQRVRSLAAATALQLALFGIRRGAHHAAVFVRADEDVQARVGEIAGVLEPLVARGAIEICFERGSDGYRSAVARDGITASATAAAIAAAERIGMDAAQASFAVAGDQSAAAPFLETLSKSGLAAHGFDPSTPADIVIAIGSAPAFDADGLAKTGARVVVGAESGAVTPAVERALGQVGGISVPEQLGGAGLVIACDLDARGVPPDDAPVRVARAVADATTSCLEEAQGTGLPLREVVIRRALIARGLDPARARGHPPRAG
jgi:hypothetical protein